MCGIVGYIGKNNTTQFLLKGLLNLEYRGYDSAGIALISEKNLTVFKETGKIQNLKETVSKNNPKGNIGIGHTRWATHGVPSKTNSHPHTNGKGDIAVVHNGIIENYEILKSSLMDKGYSFVSETDTEVIPHLIDYYYEDDLEKAVRKTIKALEGSFAIGVISEREPDKIVAALKGSRLIAAKNENGSFIASDIPAILEESKNIYYLEDNEIVILTDSSVIVKDTDGNIIKKDETFVDYSFNAAKKCGFEHYMLKEIYEQPKAISNTIKERLNKELTLSLEIDKNDFLKYEKIYIVACGTAFHAGLVGKRIMEKLARIPVDVVLASEFKYQDPILNDKALVVVISQSGETADTISVLRMAHEMGTKVLAIVNVPGSSIAREADYVLYTYAGPEIAVASTKAYTTQLAVLYLFALTLAEARQTAEDSLIYRLKKEIYEMPEKINSVLELNDKVKCVAEKIYKYDDIYYLGRGFDYAVASEGSLKLKEVSYIHSEAYAGGELKHGPIALIEENTPVIAISTDDNMAFKMDSNIKEVSARGAYIIGVVSKAAAMQKETFNDLLMLPDVHPYIAPMLAIVPLQLLAYHTSIKRGCDVDKPRNLAKSVTVE